MKSLYTFIICDCSGAGIWSADFEVASLYTGHKLDKTKFDKFFLTPQKAYDLGNGKYFFPDFIEHQYPKGLSSHNPAHKNVILELNKYQLIKENNKGAWEVLKRPFEGSQVIVIDTVIVKDKEKVKETVKETGHPILDLAYKDFSRVMKMKEPLTAEQADTLLKKYGQQTVEDYLGRLHNWKNIHNNTSAYLTITGWMKRDGITEKEHRETPAEFELRMKKEYEQRENKISH